MKSNPLSTALAIVSMAQLIGQKPVVTGKRVTLRSEVQVAELNAADERAAWNRRVDAERAAKHKTGDVRKALAKQAKQAKQAKKAGKR